MASDWSLALQCALQPCAKVLTCYHKHCLRSGVEVLTVRRVPYTNDLCAIHSGLGWGVSEWICWAEKMEIHFQNSFFFSRKSDNSDVFFTVTDHYHRSVRKTAQTSHCPSPSIKNKCGAATVWGLNILLSAINWTNTMISKKYHHIQPACVYTSIYWWSHATFSWTVPTATSCFTTIPHYQYLFMCLWLVTHVTKRMNLLKT